MKTFRDIKFVGLSEQYKMFHNFYLSSPGNCSFNKSIHTCSAHAELYTKMIHLNVSSYIKYSCQLDFCPSGKFILSRLHIRQFRINESNREFAWNMSSKTLIHLSM